MYIGYARASLDTQNLDRQLDELAAYGVDPRNIYHEKTTGTRRDRPELNRMLAQLRPGDVIVFVELTRLGRSLIDLVNIVETIEQKGAAFISLKERMLDTTTTEGKLIFGVFAVLAEFERNRLSDRIKSGLQAAKARGNVGGRPSKRNQHFTAVELFYQSGKGATEIHRLLGGVISISTIQRIFRDLRAKEQP
jgi:DNA invertase Pin-like site-specific DNA recombinase